ncbi:SPOR domain-containing protein [Succinatimonas hippei]|uniref:SPOR domain-containing protein n=1 Tax=Succinatimonas hippei TaxID=626938 RepID=UPI0026EDC6B9|nr:SPOR domain-containing protein [Succinatimonas hippei]
MENIVELQSQQELAQRIIRKLSGIEPVVLLCGETGSGRSTICHLAAEIADDKMQVIFLPCNSSLSKENLRELLLQQLFPEENVACNYPLTETLLKVDVTNLKALIIADDIDDVPLEFLREVNTLVEELSGKLLFLGVCAAESAKAASSIFNVEPIEVPPLDYKECIFLSREYLASQNKMEVFEGHWDKLPTLFKSKIYTPAVVFATVDGFDEDTVAKTGRERFSADESAVRKDENSAKSSSKWPYLLILAALVGGGAYYFMDKDEAKPQTSVVEEEKVPEATVDGGALNEKIDEGIEVEGKDSQLQNELVISGDALEKIEESSINKASINTSPKNDDATVSGDASSTGSSKEISAAVTGGEKEGNQKDAAKDSSFSDSVSSGDNKAELVPAKQESSEVSLPEKEPEDIKKPIAADNADQDGALPAEKADAVLQQVKDEVAKTSHDAVSQAASAALPAVSAVTSKAQDAVEQVKHEVKETQSAIKEKVDDSVQKVDDLKDEINNEVKEASSVLDQEEKTQVLVPVLEDKSQNIGKEESALIEEKDNLLNNEKEASENLVKEVKEEIKPEPEVCPENTSPAEAGNETAEKTAGASHVIDRSEVKHRVSQTGPVKAVITSSNKNAQAKKRVPAIDKTLRFDRIPFTGEAIPGAVAEIALKDNSHYTVQVVSAYSRARAVEVSAGVKGRYWIYETVRNNRPWYVLINGDYSSASEAQAAVNRLPRALKASGPFVKKFSQVKFEMDKKK